MMAHEKDQIDDELDPKVADKLSTDLKALFRVHASVPPEIDRAVIDRARTHLVRRWPKQTVRWTGAVAAAAAAIIFIFVLESPRESGLEAPRFEKATSKMAADRMARPRVDIDGSGRVDILDAFILAKHMESIDQPQTKWDLNGDGLINRKDVDTVAFAAVRLNRGVM